MNPILLTAANEENQDRGIVLHNGARLELAVADGAGGQAGGMEAAIMACAFLRDHSASLLGEEDCVELLRRMDAAIATDPVAGETTVALAVVTAHEVFGASVGDSGAWLIPAEGELINLTIRQQRRPFIGSGNAWPVSFRYPRPHGLILLATDGLLKYTSAERIVETCKNGATEATAQQLIDLVKYPSGNLPDDVTVILGKV
jgi:serine/threonine protein phosphatase PrpC